MGSIHLIIRSCVYRRFDVVDSSGHCSIARTFYHYSCSIYLRIDLGGATTVKQGGTSTCDVTETSAAGVAPDRAKGAFGASSPKLCVRLFA